MRAALTITTLTLFSGPAIAAQPITVTGLARVIDGDTIDVRGQRIRIHGIDAPEAAQTCDRAGQTIPCGQESTEALGRKVGNAQVSCTGSERDQYDRLIAVCRVAGIDLGGWMVEQGRAVAFVRFSSDYVGQEAQAKQRKAGLWAMSFVMPWDYRREIWEASQAGTAAAPAAGAKCLIKGNISAKGERIYHVPGQSFYARTTIELDKGERWFCSTKEAEAAGWRASER